MLRSNSKSVGNHVVSPEEEKERLQCEGCAEKEGIKPGMKEWVGDGKLIIISMAVSSINKKVLPPKVPVGVRLVHCCKLLYSVYFTLQYLT